MSTQEKVILDYEAENVRVILLGSSYVLLDFFFLKKTSSLLALVLFHLQTKDMILKPRKQLEAAHTVNIFCLVSGMGATKKDCIFKSQYMEFKTFIINSYSRQLAISNSKSREQNKISVVHQARIVKFFSDRVMYNNKTNTYLQKIFFWG